MADAAEEMPQGQSQSQSQSQATESPTKSGTNLEIDSNIKLGNHETDEELLKKLWIASFITKHPFIVWFLLFVIIILLTFADSFAFEIIIGKSRFNYVESDKYVKKFDAWTLATEEVVNSNEDTDAFPQTESESLFTIQMMFELNSYKRKIDSNNPNNTNYWILTPENLEIIIKYENEILDDKDWNTYYCYVTDTTTYDCEYFSLAQQVYSHFGRNFSNMTTSSIKAYIKSLHNKMPSYVEPAFNEKFGDTYQTYIYRSFFYGGLPIAANNGTNINGTIIKTSKWSNADDDYDGQEDEYNEWAKDIWMDITVDHNADLKEDDLRIVTLINSVYNDYFLILLLEGMRYIIFAVALVIFWMTVHLQSVFLSFISVLQILLTFPMSYAIYYYVLGVNYFDFLSLLIVFVLLGVGADDVFVFMDAWRQSLYYVPDTNNLESRMTFAYRRATKAMLVTQVTTFFAFAATAISLLKNISAFGIWASTIVFCNFIIVTTMFPSLLIIHHKYILPIEKKFCCCCLYKNKGRNQKIAKSPVAKNTKIEMAAAESGKNDENKEDTNENEELVEEQAEEFGFFERFFGTTWTFYVTKFRIVILLFFAVLFSISLWQASKIEAQDENETWFNDDHYMQLATDLAKTFSASAEDGLVELNVAWGINGVDREKSDYWDPEDYGTVIWDSSFDMSSPEQQLYLKDACDYLSTSDLIYSKDTFICAMDYIELYANATNEPFPWIYTLSNLNDSNSSYDASIQKEEFAKFLYKFTMSEYAYDVLSNSLLYITNDSDSGAPEIKYIALFTYTTVSWTQSASDAKDARDEWQSYLKDTFYNNEDCPIGVCKPIQASNRWPLIRTMVELVRSALSGILIALPLAFVVLLISTRNWIISVFATLDIIGVIACELAFMALQGWKFGISESVSIVIIIGFSVDYVVHFANAYLESTSPLRSERLSFSLLTMGISVASGAITTLLAGIILIFPEIIFFQKMGLLIVTTILFSILWALGFFVAILSCCGPQNKQGNIPIEKWCKKCQNSMDADKE